jgi:hypothetical protein
VDDLIFETWEEVCENAKTKATPALKKKVIPQLKKQHSILFSVVPSRDQQTGQKVVTSDDAHEDTAGMNTTRDNVTVFT